MSDTYDYKDFYDHYDKIVEKWLDDTKREELIKEDCYFNAENQVNRNNDVRLSRERLEIPEPYFGDPEECSAVIINFNPGMAGDDSRDDFYKNLAKDLSNGSYSEFAKKFPCLDEEEDKKKRHPGYDFWNKKNIWIQRLCQLYGVETDLRPFAVELCPYHSSGWNGDFINDDVRKHIQDWVFTPALAAVNSSNLPFALAIGKGCYDELIMFGFEEKFRLKNSSTDNVQWPTRKKDGCKVNRSFAVLTREKNDPIVLCTWCPGTNSAPAKRFRKVEELILEKIKEIQKNNE